MKKRVWERSNDRTRETWEGQEKCEEILIYRNVSEKRRSRDMSENRRSRGVQLEGQEKWSAIKNRSPKLWSPNPSRCTRVPKIAASEPLHEAPLQPSEAPPRVHVRASVVWGVCLLAS